METLSSLTFYHFPVVVAALPGRAAVGILMNIGGLFFGSKRQSGLFGTPSPAAVQFVTILACLTVTLAISFAVGSI